MIGIRKAPSVTYDVKKGMWVVTQDYRPEPPVRLPMIPQGFRTDLASVPRFFWRFLAPFELSIEAPLVHDFLYRRHLFPRWYADSLLYDLAVKAGVPKWKARIAWLAVRWFGWFAWRKHDHK